MTAKLRPIAAGVMALLGALVVLVVLVSACGGGPPRPSSAHAGSAPVSLHGTFTLWGTKSQPNPCTSTPAGTDLGAGTPVVVRDTRGRTLAEGRLSQPKPDSFRLGCVFRFNLNHLPKADSYKIGVGKRDGLSYSYDELAQLGWVVGLNLGVAP